MTEPKMKDEDIKQLNMRGFIIQIGVTIFIFIVSCALYPSNFLINILISLFAGWLASLLHNIYYSNRFVHENR
jgi:uncharacterized membrane protein YeaQ/YmgE (transglycosylase-associated protein family)